jgi:hypothetical protein
MQSHKCTGVQTPLGLPGSIDLMRGSKLVPDYPGIKETLESGYSGIKGTLESGYSGIKGTLESGYSGIRILWNQDTLASQHH